MLLTSGILLLDKPAGVSSHRFINSFKQAHPWIKKIGHAGTLDPFATGLLIVMLNNATKLSDFLMNATDKHYDVVMQLYQKTDTGDITGQPIVKVPLVKRSIFTKETIEKALNHFNGCSYQQTPPAFSAIKWKGQPLYKYARHNKIINVPPRWVTIHNINLMYYDPSTGQVHFQVICSKGTYIRSLVEDIGTLLNTPATTFSLRRTQIGSWHLPSYNDSVQSSEDSVIGWESIFGNWGWPIVSLSHQQYQIAKNGGQLAMLDYKSNIVVVQHRNSNYLAIYDKVSLVDKTHSIYHCRRVLVAGE